MILVGIGILAIGGLFGLYRLRRYKEDAREARRRLARIHVQTIGQKP